MASSMSSQSFFSFSLSSLLPVFVAIVLVTVTYLVRKYRLVKTLFNKPDPTSNRHGGELVADVLASHGVKYIFTLCGGHISPLLVASEKKGMKIVDVRHEVTTVFAADAVARLSGTVGVAAVTAGPGLTNTVTAVKNAQMAESPVLLLGGAAAILSKGRGALQDIDQLSLFTSICKFSATVKYVADIAPTLRKAIQVAQSGTPGPVFVELPIDTLYPYPIIKSQLGQVKEPKSFQQRVANMYLQFYIDSLFAGAFSESTATGPLPTNIPMPTQSQIQRSINLVNNAKKPLILLGSQSTLPPVPAERLRKSLEDMRIPCFLGGMSRGLLGRNSNLQIRQRRKDALKECDVVILAGAVCDFRLSYGRVLSRRSKIIAVNRNRQQLYKNTDMFWKPTEAVQADVATFLVSLQAGLQKCNFSLDEDWLNCLRNRDKVVEDGNKQKALQATEKHLNPLKVLYEVEDSMPEDSIIVADGGDFVGSAAYILRPRGPLRWLDPGAFGTLGVGGGFALGAKLVHPECEVWVIYGDGSFGYSISEFDTYSRHKTPVMAVIGNDACWSQIAREQVPMLGSDTACNLQYTAYHHAVEGLGSAGMKLGREDDDLISQVLQQARTTYALGKSVVINAMIGKTDFREGSISV